MTANETKPDAERELFEAYYCRVHGPASDTVFEQYQGEYIDINVFDIFCDWYAGYTTAQRQARAALAAKPEVGEDGWFIPLSCMSAVAQSQFRNMNAIIKHGGQVDVIARVDAKEYRWQCDGLKYAKLQACGTPSPAPNAEDVVTKLRDALLALKAQELGDYVYDVRSRASESGNGFEGNSWEHPDVLAFSAAIDGIESGIALADKYLGGK